MRGPLGGSPSNGRLDITTDHLFHVIPSVEYRPMSVGLRSNRYSMLVRDGKVVTLNVEAPGKFEVSDADTLLAQAKAA